MRIFLATPISSFDDIEEYKKYRSKVVKLVKNLRIEHDVICELDEIDDSDKYDSPQDSFDKDFSAITSCDVFILHYPSPTPTSALIELGFALALKKRVIIVTPDRTKLPYLMQSIDLNSTNCFIIENKFLGKVTTQKIVGLIED